MVGTIHGGPSFDDWQMRKFVPAGRRRIAKMAGDRIDKLFGDMTFSFIKIGEAAEQAADALTDFRREYVQASRVAMAAVPPQTYSTRYVNMSGCP